MMDFRGYTLKPMGGEMTRLLFHTVLFAVLAITIPSHVIKAQEFNSDQRKEIEGILHNYIIQNPEIIEEAFYELEKRREEEERIASIESIRNNSDILFHSDFQVVLGNPDGDVTMVEFFDYNCGYCKRVLVEILQLLEEDKNLRLVLKEYPVLGESSVLAARVSVAAHLVDSTKFAEFHQKLLLGQNRADQESALNLADEMGYDMVALNEAMENPEVVSTIQEVYRIASELNIRGTPSFVIGEEVIKGAIPLDIMKEKIDSMRNIENSDLKQ